MSASKTSVDWNDARQRIERLGDRLEDGPDSNDVRQVLLERAQRLAAPVERPRDAGGRLEVMLVELAGERFALETGVIREVIRVSPLTLLPNTEPWFAGVINLRGRPLLIVDGCELLGLRRQGSGEEQEEASRIVVLGAQQAEFGLLTASTLEVMRVEPGEVLDPPPSLPDTARPFVRGVTAEAVTVLDVGRLMNDARLWIDDQDE